MDGSVLLVASALVGGPVAVGAIVLGIVQERKERRAFARKAAAEAIEHEKTLVLDVLACILFHEAALRRRMHQKLYSDPYGRIIEDKALSEARYFFDNVLVEALQPANEADLRIIHRTFVNWLQKLDLDAFVEAEEPPPPGDGLGYERLVAARLATQGYSISFTPQSGDQGVDLIATRGEQRIAIQCKNYRRPVGNDAVQQIFAGARFYGAQIAIVVAPNGYTVSALQLAQSLGVHCTSEEALADLLATELLAPAQRDVA